MDLEPSAYAEICPLGAVSGERTLEVCGRKMTVANIDYAKCRKCKNGAGANRKALFQSYT